MARVAGGITVALLSALTVMHNFAAGIALVLDALAAAPLTLGAGAAGVVRWWR